MDKNEFKKDVKAQVENKIQELLDENKKLYKENQSLKRDIKLLHKHLKVVNPS